MVKVDLHVHTCYSPDSVNYIRGLREVCTKKGIIPAITDHNTFEGAVIFEANCIRGEEIETTEGEIIGLFLTEEIRGGLTIEETVDKIREQGAIVYVPHPFDMVRGSAIKRLNFKIDILEVFNAANILSIFNKRAYDYAKRKNLLMGVGSDAHFLSNVGKAYLEMEPFDLESPKEFLKNLKNAKMVTKKVLPFYSMLGFLVKEGRKIGFFKKG